MAAVVAPDTRSLTKAFSLPKSKRHYYALSDMDTPTPTPPPATDCDVSMDGDKPQFNIGAGPLGGLRHWRLTSPGRKSEMTQEDQLFLRFMQNFVTLTQSLKASREDCLDAGGTTSVRMRGVAEEYTPSAVPRAEDVACSDLSRSEWKVAAVAGKFRSRSDKWDRGADDDDCDSDDELRERVGRVALGRGESTPAVRTVPGDTPVSVPLPPATKPVAEQPVNVGGHVGGNVSAGETREDEEAASETSHPDDTDDDDEDEDDTDNDDDDDEGPDDRHPLLPTPDDRPHSSVAARRKCCGFLFMGLLVVAIATGFNAHGLLQLSVCPAPSHADHRTGVGSSGEDTTSASAGNVTDVAWVEVVVLVSLAAVGMEAAVTAAFFLSTFTPRDRDPPDWLHALCLAADVGGCFTSVGLVVALLACLPECDYRYVLQAVSRAALLLISLLAHLDCQPTRHTCQTQ